jgi:hypothetical protein
MKKLLIFIISIFIFASCINTENAEIEIIKQDQYYTYYLIKLKNGDKYYGTLGHWYDINGGIPCSDFIEDLDEVVMKNYWKEDIENLKKEDKSKEDVLKEKEKALELKERELDSLLEIKKIKNIKIIK